MIAGIVCAESSSNSNRWCIGNDNNLIYHIKDDMKRFKQITMNNVIIMGYNTYKSIKTRLHGRRVIVITKSHEKELKDENEYNLSFKTFLSIQQSLLDTYNIVYVENDVYSLIPKIKYCDKFKLPYDFIVCGGSEIYKEFLPYIQEFYTTLVYSDCESGNKFIPDLSKIIDEWESTYDSEILKENNVRYQYLNYKRIN